VKKIIYVCFVVFLFGASSIARAENVTIFQEKEENVSTMEQRQKAMNLAFAQAVVNESLKMLPGSLAEERQALLKLYYLDRAGNYVQGYRQISATPRDGGLSLTMDVTVNRRALRDSLKKLGVYYTVSQPVSASFHTQGNLDQQGIDELKSLMELSGIERGLDVLPEFHLQREGEKLWRGTLVMDGLQWTAVKKDVPEVWFDLWGRYFETRAKQDDSSSFTQLRVNGWFTPDGVHDFDRVLQSWDSAVQEVRLVEMEMLPSGVAAVWKLRVVNLALLRSRLDAFLPDRGLSYGVSSAQE